MKKLALSLAVLFAVGLVSCGGNKEDKACDSVCDTPAVEEVAVVEEVATDSANVADTAAAAAAEVAEAPAAE